MKNLSVIAIAAAIGLVAGSPSRAQGLSKEEYQGARKTIESDFRTAKMGCEPMLANVKTICMADVRGREGIALAELVAAQYPSADASMDVRIAKARAGLAVARARCEDVPLPRKDACRVEAEAAHEAALAPAALPATPPTTTRARGTAP